MVSTPTGSPVTKFTISARPDAPPGAILAGTTKQWVPTLYTNEPARRHTIFLNFSCLAALMAAASFFSKCQLTPRNRPGQ